MRCWPGSRALAGRSEPSRGSTSRPGGHVRRTTYEPHDGDLTGNIPFPPPSDRTTVRACSVGGRRPRLPDRGNPFICCSGPLVPFVGTCIHARADRSVLVHDPHRGWLPSPTHEAECYSTSTCGLLLSTALVDGLAFRCTVCDVLVVLLADDEALLQCCCCVQLPNSA